MKALLQHCSDEEYRAWAAPFPSEEYIQGARQFPSLVPIIPDNPALPANRAAWKFFESCDKQFLTAYGDSDPVTRGQETRFIENVPGAKDQKHRIIKGAGHFLQDDVGAALADVIVEFMRDNSARDQAGE